MSQFSPLYPPSLISTVSISTTNSLTTCEIGDINVNYTLTDAEYNSQITKLKIKKSAILFNNVSFNTLSNTFIKSIPNGKKSLDVCVPRKCNDGSHPINIGKLADSTRNIDMYVCASPGLYDNNNKCLNGGKFIKIPNTELGMCVDLPKYYFKDFQ